VTRGSTALVVFLRGVNVGGHRTFRPAALARDLDHLGAVNIGAAGTFIFRKRMPLKRLRAALARRLPFETQVFVCGGAAIEQLIATEPYGNRRQAPDVVRFISVLPNKKPRTTAFQLPAKGKWLVRVVGQHDRFIVGEYRRDMKTIGYLGQLDRLIGVPVTTRNWTTINTIARALTR
jgi:uncharacterized protein (DUF1697 family)